MVSSATAGDPPAQQAQGSAEPGTPSTQASTQTTGGGDAKKLPDEPKPISTNEDDCPTMSGLECLTSNPEDCVSSNPKDCISTNPDDCPSFDPDNCTSFNPDDCPSTDPDDCPSADPDDCPSLDPDNCPSLDPDDCPSLDPDNCPSMNPNDCPSLVPNDCPSTNPNDCLSLNPNDCPSLMPANCPSTNPNDCPSLLPNNCPSLNPADCPSLMPANCPSLNPADCPSLLPTNCPSLNPDSCPTSSPPLCEEDPCCNPLLCRPNEGEAEINGKQEDHIFFCVDELGDFTVTHRIVTIETGRARDLFGKMKMSVLSGDPSIIQLVHIDTGAPYAFGTQMQVVEPGHVGCGIHTWHQGYERFRVTALRAGSLKIEVEVDPDPENPEGDGVPTKKATIYIHILDMDVDSNRDGTVDDNDDDDEDWWTNDRGAIFMVNYDKDAGGTQDGIDFNDAGAPIAEDSTIQGGGDTSDIAPLVFGDPGSEGFGPGVQIILKALGNDAQAIHVFKKIAAGEARIWGGLTTGTPAEIDITQYLDPDSPNFQGGAGDIEFGIEGLLFANDVNTFDGFVDLLMEIHKDGSMVCSDDVRLKVAPWFGNTHQEGSTDLFAADYGPINAAFLAGLPAPTTTTPAESESQWIQDHVEVGWTHFPGGPKTQVAFRLPYGTQPAWIKNHLLDSDFGTFQLGAALGAGAGDFGGNVEVIPPTASRPLGRMVVGDTASATLLEFFDDQDVQDPVLTPPTQWLSVGHVDEVFGFTGTGTQAIVSNPTMAWNMMQGVANPGGAVFFATGGPPLTGTVVAGPTASNRLNTSADHTGTPWQFVRIYNGTGGGQIAEITAVNTDHILVGDVWDTTSKVVPPAGAPGTPCMYNNLEGLWPAAGWATQPAVGDGYVLLRDSQFYWKNATPWTPAFEFPAAITVAEVLADADFQTLNLNWVQPKINWTKAALTTAGVSGFIEVPTLYLGLLDNFDTGRNAVAFNPGLANFQKAGGAFYFPKPYAYLNGGADAFEAAVTGAVGGANFIDDWNLYHNFDGEVHCGTTAVRTIPGLNWWDNLP